MSDVPKAHEMSVVVTGAGSGIGRAVATRLLQRGVRVFAAAISEQEAADLQKALPGDVHTVVLDVRDEASVATAVKQVAAVLEGQPLHALLNIAGMTINGPLLDLSADRFHQLLAVNLVGVHVVTREFVPLLGRHQGARVINMSSASGRRTMPFAGAYSASKFALEALSQAMRLEFTPFGIAVSVIAPGMINTPMASAIQDQLSQPSSHTAYAEPLKRFLAESRKVATNGVPLDKAVTIIVDSVVAATPKRRYEIHQNFVRDVLLMRALPDGVRDTIVTRVLALSAPATKASV